MLSEEDMFSFEEFVLGNEDGIVAPTEGEPASSGNLESDLGSGSDLFDFDLPFLGSLPNTDYDPASSTGELGSPFDHETEDGSTPSTTPGTSEGAFAHNEPGTSQDCSPTARYASLPSQPLSDDTLLYPLLIDPRTVYIPPFGSEPQPHHALYPPPPSLTDSQSLSADGPTSTSTSAALTAFETEVERERRAKRRATNRASAKAFRARRKSSIQEHQALLEERDAEVARLRNEAETLRQQNEALRSDPNSLEEDVDSHMSIELADEILQMLDEG